MGRLTDRWRDRQTYEQMEGLTDEQTVGPTN